MPPPPLFIVAVNLYLIYILFKKPRAKPCTMYYEQQNTKLVFELNDGPLIKVAPAPAPAPMPTPMPTPAPEPMSTPAQSFVYNSLVKEQVPKVEVIESVPDTLLDIVLEAISEVVSDTLQNIVPDVVIEAIPDLAPIILNDNVNVNISETDPSIYAKYFTNFDRIAFLQTNIKNYTIVVHYENKTASIPYSNHLEVLPIYMNVVTLMNPK